MSSELTVKQHSNSFMHNTLTRHLTSSEFSSREADADEDNDRYVEHDT